MVTVSLYDTLTVTELDSGAIVLECDDASLPTGSDNLVVKAALRLKAATGCARGARISLTKAIPAEAGLAGGSSDAAATLAALDRIWDLRMPANRLDAVAGEIGSDVAFFLHAPAAICRGRGEHVEVVPIRQPLHFVLVAPTIGLSTAEVYRHLRPPETPRMIGPVCGGWPKRVRPPWDEACSTGFNPLPKRFDPIWCGFETPWQTWTLRWKGP